MAVTLENALKPPFSISAAIVGKDMQVFTAYNEMYYVLQIPADMGFVFRITVSTNLLVFVIKAGRNQKIHHNALLI